MRGAPGCGKSTFIKQMGWEGYTICPDDIRMMYLSTQHKLDGSECINMQTEQQVWSFVYNLLELRFEHGAFTVLDATNSKTEEMRKARNLATKYKYRIYMIDMTNIPISVVKEQNANRYPEYKRVPNDVIERQYSRFDTQKIPKNIEVIEWDSFNKTSQMIEDKLRIKPLDFNKYKKIVHIGDIHGCATVLKQAIPRIEEDTMYIFCGDYLDRGIENAEVAKYLSEIIDLPNVMLLEGNHECHLQNYGTSILSKSRQFNRYTVPELTIGGISPSVVHTIRRRCAQFAYYTYNGYEVLANHGGVPYSTPSYLYPARELVHGVGRYDDVQLIIDSFNEKSKSYQYQVFGHRNPMGLPVQNGRCFCLEGRVEFGGNLRLAVLDEDGWHTEQYVNTVFKEQAKASNTEDIAEDSIVRKLQSNPYIKQKSFGNISSFNFTREAFRRGKWDEQTISARGLFIETATDKVVARAYDKFFNLEERMETSLYQLTHTLKFPVQVYQKENGYLGIISYDAENDSLMMCSKSSMDSEHVEWFKEILDRSGANKETIKEFVKHGWSLICEVIDPVNDPHIIKYDKEHIFLLDAVQNNLDSKFLPYKDLVALASAIGIEVKKHVATLNNIQEFKAFTDETKKDEYMLDGKRIEGFVFDDANHFRVKVKTQYYIYWKSLRAKVDLVKRHGNLLNASSLYNPEMNYFYDWVKNYLYQKDQDELVLDIVTLRDLFYEDHPEFDLEKVGVSID